MAEHSAFRLFWRTAYICLFVSLVHADISARTSQSTHRRSKGAEDPQAAAPIQVKVAAGGSNATAQNLTTTTARVQPSSGAASAAMAAAYNLPTAAVQQSGPLFQPLETSAPPSSLFGSPATNYPRQPVNLANPAGLPVGTNKWYNQLLLPAAGTDPVFPLPYAIAYLNGTSLLSGPATGFVGVGVMHSTAAQRVYGPNATANPVQYYLNPLDVSMSLGASEISAENVRAALTSWSELAAAFSLSPGVDPAAASATQRLTIPLSRGSAFVTGLYSGLTPTIRSSLAITGFKTVGTVNGFTKCRVSYNDGSNWLLYSSPRAGTSLPVLKLVKANATDLASSQGAWSGIIQVAKMSSTYVAGGKEEAVYDAGVGVWVTGATIVSGAAGSGVYGFDWVTAGPRSARAGPLIFALPHHVASLTTPSSPVSPLIQLASRTNGNMNLYTGKTWLLKEDVSTVSKYSYLPTNPTFGAQTQPTNADLAVLKSVAVQELATDFSAEANLGSYYFSGKKLAKQALQCLAISTFLKDPILKSQCISKAEASLLQFVQGNQTAAKLRYETTWKGIISSSYLVTGNEFDDFGNGVYNDHHFHFGYFVHAAGVLSSLDPSFIARVAPFITSLIRDVNNPSTTDKYFPFSRNFDWFVGHSWATGLQTALDGKNEESSSEDVNFFYGLKVWAEATSQTQLAGLANLQLAILRRSLNAYYLLRDPAGSSTQPANFVRNRVPGIVFENKVDHTTFFSPNEDAIHMIQAIPTIPLMPYWRDLAFVAQEWSSSGTPGSTPISALAAQRSNGYQTLLYVQYAVLAPRQVVDTLKANLNTTVIDDGASLTWSLAFAFSQLGKTGGKF